jgi:hypothetical protein
VQALTAAPRDNLTDAQVTSLLTSPSLEVSAGCELLDADLTVREDISDDLAGGRVSRNSNATVHGTCDLAVSRSLAWGVDLVRPYMILTDGLTGVTARWNVGVYALTTPERTVGETPETYDVQGFDRLYLLSRQVGADYTVAAGVTYRQALLDVFAVAGLSGVLIEGSAADDTLPVSRTWALVSDRVADPDQTDTPVTWLRIVNDLLRAINFRSVWADQDGVFRCAAYQDPASRAAEWTFDTDPGLTILGEDRTVVEDRWKTPNRWVFRRTNGGTGVEGDGVYTVDLSDTVNGDWLGRTLVWTSVVDYEAASQAKLVALGDRRVALDRMLTIRFDVTTGPFPGAGHFDVFEYQDAAAGGTRKVQAVSWDMPLDGGDVRWTWEAVS